MYFFTTTGEYGKRTTESDELYSGKDNGWMAIPVWSWTSEMWDEIHSVAGNERYTLANHFSINVHDWVGSDSNAECAVCHLAPEDVGIRLLDIKPKSEQIQELMEQEYYYA
jgi:hypothetical protein